MVEAEGLLLHATESVTIRRGELSTKLQFIPPRYDSNLLSIHLFFIPRHDKTDPSLFAIIVPKMKSYTLNDPFDTYLCQCTRNSINTEKALIA